DLMEVVLAHRELEARQRHDRVVELATLIPRVFVTLVGHQGSVNLAKLQIFAPRSFPIGIRHQSELFAASIGLDHEGTGAAALIEMVYPEPAYVALVLNELALDDIGGGIRQRLQEIR